MNSQATVEANSGMYILGGQDKSKDKIYSDIFFLDFSSMEMFSIQTNCESLPRVNHSAVYDSASSSIIVVGGKGINFR